MVLKVFAEVGNWALARVQVSGLLDLGYFS